MLLVAVAKGSCASFLLAGLQADSNTEKFAEEIVELLTLSTLLDDHFRALTVDKAYILPPFAGITYEDLF
jgi:hypothetical protein